MLHYDNQYTYVHAICILYLFQHVNQPTRFRQDHSPHMLDLYLQMTKIWSMSLQYLPSLANGDHVCLQFTLSLNTPNVNINPSYKYSLRRADFNTMNSMLIGLVI